MASRLDVFLSSELKISRSQIANLIKNGSVLVNNKISLKPSLKLEISDIVSVDFPEISAEISPSEKIDFDIKIIYEDEEILVINKPAGLVVHPAPSVKELTLVEWLKSKNYMLSTINGEIRAGIVHRIDKPTSGALIIAKTNHAHAALSEQLENKSMGRIYLAFIDFALKQNVVVEKFIARNPNNRLKKAVVAENFAGARFAKSAFLNIHTSPNSQNFKTSNAENFNLIAAKLFTGRTHQIRVHLASLNRHILGDFLYGFKSEFDRMARILLHAYLLYFKHPLSGELKILKADLPQDFKEIIENSTFKDEIYEKILPNSLISSFDSCGEWLLSN